MKFLNVYTEIVADLDPDYAAVFGDAYVPVDDSTPLTTEPCCGQTDDTESEGSDA